MLLLLYIIIIIIITIIIIIFIIIIIIVVVVIIAIMFEIGLCLDDFKQSLFKHGMMLDITKLYILIPVLIPLK